MPPASAISCLARQTLQDPHDPVHGRREPHQAQNGGTRCRLLERQRHADDARGREQRHQGETEQARHGPQPVAGRLRRRSTITAAIVPKNKTKPATLATSDVDPSASWNPINRAKARRTYSRTRFIRPPDSTATVGHSVIGRYTLSAQWHRRAAQLAVVRALPLAGSLSLQRALQAAQRVQLPSRSVQTLPA